MLERTRKPRTEVAHFAGPAKKLKELREYAAKLGCQEVDESIPWCDTSNMNATRGYGVKAVTPCF